MKSEDRIVELLAESLRKQDVQEEILNKLVEGQERLIQEFRKTNDHLLTRQEKLEDRIVRLEDKVFKG